jgi:hypothetical protein
MGCGAARLNGGDSENGGGIHRRLVRESYSLVPFTRLPRSRNTTRG